MKIKIFWILQVIFFAFVGITAIAQSPVTLNTIMTAMKLGTVFTYTYDIATPVGTDAPSVLDDRDRETKAAVQERLNVDHYFALTGTQVSDAASGQHRQIEFYGPISKPSSATNKGWLYSKDVSAKVELHWEDEDGDEIQLTDGGAFNMALLTSKTITTPTLTSPVINTGVSGTAILDEDDLVSDSSTKLATQQSIKAYVDEGYSPVAYTGGESITFPNGFIWKFGQQALVNSSYADTSVTFTVAFPTECVSVMLTSWDTDETQGDYTPSAHTFTTSGFKIRSRIGSRLSPVGWEAKGY